jgi:hypothetical protein
MAAQWSLLSKGSVSVDRMNVLCTISVVYVMVGWMMRVHPPGKYYQIPY